MTIPIQSVRGLELIPATRPGIAHVHVVDQSGINSLSWDRYVRLKATAEALRECGATRVLDVGGFDGALAFFLPKIPIDLIDPATTGASILEIPSGDREYEAVVSVDVLEHIEPSQRTAALHELSRVTNKYLVLNYPSSESKTAQELIYLLTNNSLIKEHVQWALPDDAQVIEELSKRNFECQINSHSSIAIWLGQYALMNLAPDAGASINRYLVDNHSDEPAAKALYRLIVARRLS